MSKLNIWRTSPLLCLGLAVTLGLTFLIGLLLMTSATRPPDVVQAQISTTTVAPSMLAVTKQANPDPVQAGSPLTYTIRVTNTGDITLTATITDILPGQVTPACIRTWTPNPIAPHDVWTQHVAVTVKMGYSGTLTNIVQVTTEEGVMSTYTETSTAQAQVPFTNVVVITPTAISHELEGVGVHMFDSDYRNPKFTSTLDALGLECLRVPFGPEWNELAQEPPACNDVNFEKDYPLMYKFISENFNGDYPDRLTNAISISNIAEGRNIEVIFLNWRAHENWLTDPTYRELEDDYVDDYACFVTAVVEFLTNNGVKISYLEPTNEPSNTENTKIPPERYNTFVKFLRKYLDIEELFEVKILGPGLAYLNHDDTGRDYVEALDCDGVKAISAWASHAWDPEFCPNEPLEEVILGMKCEEWLEAIKDKEQECSSSPKPIFITEYACVNDPGNGICAVKNTLTLLDCGANAVVYWYLREQDWDLDPANHDRALLTGDYTETRTFTALTSVLPFISGDEVWVLQTQIEGRITSASFKADNDLVLVLVNSYPESENVLIDIAEFYAIGVEKRGVVYHSDTNTITRDLEFVQCQADGRYDRTRCQLSLQPNTITTLVLRFRLYLPIIMKHVDGG
jgi:uncharacterized repeat protein (TIGR01451 family)